MWRRLRISCVVLSLVLALVSVGLWVRSLHREDVVGVFARAGREGNVLIDTISLHGGLSVVVEYTPHYRWELVARDTPNGIGPWVRWSHAGRSENSDWGGNPSPLHVSFYRDDLGRPIGSLFARYWVLLIACALLPMTALLRYVAAVKRSAQGRCRVCGYDVRATPDRCPECGTAVAGTRRIG